MLAIASIVHALRDPSAIVAAGFWAEDGTVLFKDAVERGSPAVLEPYAGQLVVLQRCVAALVAPLPAIVQPIAYAFAAFAIAIGSCGVLLSRRWRDAAPLWVRFGGLLALVAVPGPAEAYVTLVNSHWWLAIGIVLLGLLRDPVSRLGRAAELGLVAVASVSGFATLYGLPALVLRAVRLRSRHAVLLVGAAAAGLMVQVVLLVASRRLNDLGVFGSDPGGALIVIVRRVFGGIAVGETNLERSWPDGGVEPAVLAVVVTLTVGLAILWIRRPRIETFALLATLAGGWLVSLWSVAGDVATLFWPLSAARYFMVPKAVVYVSALTSWRAGRDWLVVSAVVGGIMLAGIAADYAIEPRPQHDWAAFAECLDTTDARCSTTVAPNWRLVMRGRAK